VDLRRIVVGVDSSCWGLEALTWAAEHARLTGADLDVCAGAADAALDHVLRDVRRAVPRRAVPVLPSADAASALIAASRRASLVVLGCRGTRHPGLGVGSSVPAVARWAACDVVVVGGRPAAARDTGRTTVILRDDASDAATIATGVRFAVQRGDALHVVVHSCPAARGLPEPGDRADQEAHAAADVVRRLAPDLVVDADTARGEPHEVVAGLVDTDLLVVGARGELDTVARAALYHAGCPVLLARGARAQ
jgi:nucleotide-binding universal stress UspA family protein